MILVAEARSGWLLQVRCVASAHSSVAMRQFIGPQLSTYLSNGSMADAIDRMFDHCTINSVTVPPDVANEAAAGHPWMCTMRYPCIPTYLCAA